MKTKKVILLVVLGFFLIVPLIQWGNEEVNDKKLLKSKKTYSILVKIHSNTAIHGSFYGILEYKVNNKTYSCKDLGDYRSLQLGDTVLIEYAVEDHSVARVVDKYYMNKYKC